MAAVGALYPVFAPFTSADQTEEPEGRLPEYDEAIVLGEFVSGNITLNHATGQLFGDNALQIDVRDFVNANYALETTYISLEAEAVMYGSKIDPQTKELIDSAGDRPPFGGFGFVRTIRRKDQEKQIGYYFPKVQAALGNESAQTKNNNITFGTPTTNIVIFKPKYGGWRHRQECPTEEEARAWVAKKLGIETV